MATDQLTVTDATATGAHTYATAQAGTEVVLDDPMTDATLWPSVGAWQGFAQFTDPAAEDSAAAGSDFGVSSAARTDVLIPYDGTSLYEVAFKIRTAALPTTGGFRVYAGLAGIAADGETVLSSEGEPTYTGQHFCALYRRDLAQSDTYATFYGYMQGWGTPDGTYGKETSSAAAPGVMYEGVAFVRPVVFLNYDNANTDGVQYLDRVTVRRIAAPGPSSNYPILVTGDTTGKTATATATITNSTDVTGTLTADDTATPAVTATIDGLTGDTTVTLNWADAAPGETVTLTAGAATATHTYTVDGTYPVTAVGDTTGTIVTGTVTITGTALAAPENLGLDPAADPPVTATEASVAWDPVDGATGYTATATAPGQTAVTGAVEGTTADFTGLTPDTAYEVSVAALGDGTTSTDSAPATSTVTTTEAA